MIISKFPPSFHYSEFFSKNDIWIDADIQNIDGSEILQNLCCLAHRLQVLRDIINMPIYINSGVRSVRHNKRVGGRPHSLHLEGKAADIWCADLKLLDECLKNWNGGVGTYRTFNHVDIGEYRRWIGPQLINI